MFFHDPPRSYVHCETCDLIFTTPDSHLSPQQELTRYEMHDNSESNAGYVNFLDTVAQTAISCTPQGGSMLDFGCGKNAVLGKILYKQGIRCDSYDPLFNYQIDFSQKRYDTIILCEVIEHLRDLHEEVELVKRLLKSNTHIIIRTQPYSSFESFPHWWYRQDSTHINFFACTTLSFLASLLNRVCIHTIYKDIFIFGHETVQD
jgi:hypothetical protein